MHIFEGVQMHQVETARGTHTLPILYRDASLAGVFFRADLARARAMLPPTLEPWPIFGRALVFLFAWDYRDTSIGPYGELGLGFQVRRVGTRPSLLRLARDMSAQPEQGTWVQTLPVTSESAHRAGVDVWGYPKYVSPIDVRIERSRVRVRLGDELTIALGESRGPRVPSLPVVTFTEKEGRLLRTVIRVAGASTWGLGGEVRIVGDGPTATAFEALGLVGATPVASFRTHDFAAVLPAGTDVGPAAG